MELDPNSNAYITIDKIKEVRHNHTKAFYELQEKIMPEWKKWKSKLEYSLV
jgi:hypothetical protein